MNKQDQRALALQACGHYMMNHIEDIMEGVEDKRLQNSEYVLDEETLIAIEAQVKAIAETLASQSNGQLVL